MTMKNPPHPGAVVFEECIEPMGVTITDAAQALGVTRNTLSELVNGKRGISPKWPCGCPQFLATPSKAGLFNRLSTILRTFNVTGSNSSDWHWFKFHKG